MTFQLFLSLMDILTDYVMEFVRICAGRYITLKVDYLLKTFTLKCISVQEVLLYSFKHSTNIGATFHIIVIQSFNVCKWGANV